MKKIFLYNFLSKNFFLLFLVSFSLVVTSNSYANLNSTITENESEKILTQMQSVISDLTKKEDKITRNILSQQSALEILNVQITKLEKEVQIRKSFIRDRLAYINDQSGADILKQFLFSKNPSQLDANIKMLSKISLRDLQSLKTFSISLRELKYKRNEVNGKIEKLTKLKDELKQKEKKIVAQLELRDKVINKIKNNINKINNSELLKLIQNQSFLSKRGKLNFPVNSKVESQFGVSIDKEHQLVFINEGITLNAPVDEKVNAVSDGDVIFADWVDGYKYTIIISHGDHYYTVYKNLSSLQVKIDDAVKEGQVIGRTVQSIGFEIRHFKEPLDPKKWLNNKKSIAQESLHAITR